MQLCFYYLFIEGVCDRIVQYETRLQSLLISNCHDKKDDHITTLQVAMFEHNYISLTLCIYIHCSKSGLKNYVEKMKKQKAFGKIWMLLLKPCNTYMTNLIECTIMAT